MKKKDLFKIASFINKMGIDSSEWSVYDFDEITETKPFFGTNFNFPLPPGKYVVSYVDIEWNGETVSPTFAFEDNEQKGLIRFFLVG